MFFKNSQKNQLYACEYIGNNTWRIETFTNQNQSAGSPWVAFCYQWTAVFPKSC